MDKNLNLKLLDIFFIFSVLISIVTVVKTLSLGADLLAVVPWLDQWVTAFIFVIKGGVGLQDIFAQHNEHRVPLTFMIDIMDMRVFGGKGWLQFVITTLCMSSTSWAIWRVVWHSDERIHSTQVGSILIFASLFFCVSQVEVWFWPFLVGNVLSNTFVVIALCILPIAISSRSKVLFLLAIISSCLSVFGLASGILVWPLGFLIIVILERKITLNLLLWCLAASMVLGLYFHGFVRPSYHANPVDSILHSPKDMLLFIVYLMGAPLGYFGKLAVVALGTAILVSGLYVIASTSWAVFMKSTPPAPEVLTMTAIILFAFGCAFAVAGSRLNFGLDHAFSSRYTTIPVIALAALYGFGSLRCKYCLLKYQGGWVVFLLFLLVAYPRDIGILRAVSGTLKTAGIALVLKINDQDVFSKITPGSERVPDAGEYLAERNLSVFGGKKYPINVLLSDLGRVTHQHGCSGGIEKSETISSDKSAIRMTGWARMVGSPHIPERIAFVDKATDKVIGWAEPGGASAPIEGLMEGTINEKRWVGYAKTTTVGNVQAYALDSRSREFCLLE